MAQQTGAIYHQGILYSGGSGTNVTPNPQGEATDTLNTVEIDGTVYGIEGGGGSDVTITPTLNTGQKLADYSIDDTSGAIYMPMVASGDLIINPSETPTKELTKIGVSSSIEDAYLANGKIATSAGYYITYPLDKTLINGTYTVRVRDGASEYNFEVTYSGSTITKSWSAGRNNYTLTITSTTAGMSYYSGDYRNIYCDIVMMIPQMNVYSVGGINYSTDEQVIGTWIDGKTLYQKTLFFNNVEITMSDSTSEAMHEIDNIEMGWVEEVLFKDTSGINSWVSIKNSIAWTASSTMQNILWRVGNRSIYAHFYPTNSISKKEARSFYITIRYTKTID